MLTLIIGLPASGKTTFARSVISDLLVDDPTSLAEVLGQTFGHMVVAHYALCDDHTRAKAKEILSDAYPTAEINEVFFANDPQQCLLNAKGRTDKKVDEMIRLLAEHYNPPRADRAVWRPSENFNV